MVNEMLHSRNIILLYIYMHIRAYGHVNVPSKWNAFAKKIVLNLNGLLLFKQILAEMIDILMKMMCDCIR